MPNDEERPTVRSAYRDRPASVPLIGGSVGVVIAIGVVAILVCFFGWFGLHAYSVNREARIQRNSFNFQQTAQEQVIKLDSDLSGIDVQLADPAISDSQKSTLRAQRKAIARQLCDNAGRINDPEPAVATITAKEC